MTNVKIAAEHKTEKGIVMAEFIVIVGTALIAVVIPGAMIWYTWKHREEREARWEKRHREYIERTGGEIVEVKYLGNGRTKQKRGGLGGFLMGGFFGGPIGAVVGGMLPGDSVTMERFAVRYSGGDVEIQEVRPNSTEYKKLVSMLDWDEL